MLEWKEIAHFTHQLQVEGGYIIRYSSSLDGIAMVFVPHCVQIQQMQERQIGYMGALGIIGF